MNFNNQIIKEIIGIIFLFLVLFSFTSLLSFNPNDPFILQPSELNTKIMNLFGLFGSTFAGILFLFFGFGAFWIPILLGILASILLKKRINLSILLSNIGGGLLLIVTTGSILSIKQDFYTLFGQQLSAGGLIGNTTKYVVFKYSNQTGGTSILLLIWVLGFIIATGFSIVSFYEIIKSSIIIISKNIVKFIITPFGYVLILAKSNKKTQSPKIKSLSNKDKKNSQLKKISKDLKLKQPGDNLSLNHCIEFTKEKLSSKNTDNFTKQSELLSSKLRDFGVNGKITTINPGPVITTFEYQPAAGIKINKIVGLADDLALALKATTIRVIAPIPGKDVVGIEVPNKHREIVRFNEIITSESFLKADFKLTICLGKDIIGNSVSAGLEKMPHLLIAGATGSGKSVALNTIICSLLSKLTPNQIKFIMIDPKRIEFSNYNGIPHLITPVVNDVKKATSALFWSIKEMERRYKLLSEKKSKNIDQYNGKIKIVDIKNRKSGKLPYIVIIVDELADLMISASKDVEIALTRLAQMARASGIHLILATQRPSVDVLTGVIKANFPTRVSFQVSSKTDSRTIIDTNGAETLLGDGDMLFMPPGTARLQRIHGAYMSENELTRIIEFAKSHQKTKYDETVTKTQIENIKENKEHDEYYNTALSLIKNTNYVSISMLQRKLHIGYNRAARIIETMEENGVVSPSNGAKPRKVLLI